MLAAYRADDPVHWGKPLRPGSPGCWYLTRHDDIVQFLRGAGAGHARACPHASGARVLTGAAFTINDVLDRWFVFLDPPEHGRLRSTVSKGLQTAPKQCRARIEQVARDTIASLPRGVPLDLLPECAYALSVRAMAEVLGVPAADTGRLIGWAAAFIQIFDQTDESATPRIHAAFVEFFAYVQTLIDAGHQAGTQDLLGNLLSARESGAISDDEVVATAALLLLASAETTPTLIGNAVLLLLQHPAELDRLRQAPELISKAIDEVLRYESPVQLTGRQALTDFEMRGRQIRKGDYVVSFYSAANRDPGVFADAESFTITRDTNRHLGFGTGIHNCVGGSLGRLIGEVAVATLLEASPSLTLLDEDPAWRRHGSIRGLRSLRVTL